MTTTRWTRLLMAFVMALGVAPAIAHHRALVAPGGGGADTTYWPGPALSGSWFDASRDGEGYILEMLPDGTFLVVWFTYPPTGEPGQQAWLIGQGGRVSGNKIQFNEVYRGTGGVWGDAFDPGAIQRTVWGTLEFEFTDCNTAVARYVGPAAFGSGTRTLTRLTEIDQLRCNGSRALTATGGRALAGLRSHSGAWFVATRSGEGWFIEELPDGNTLVYWFTFDPQGNQAWTVGVGTRDGNRLVINDNAITRGTHFGDAFDPSDVVRTRWGSLEFTFTDCNNGPMSYASVLPGYGSGNRQSTRITVLASSPCIDGTPQARRNGTWTDGAAQPPNAQSEHDAVVLDGKIYTLGGFGDQRGFKRYDPAANLWSELIDMPAGRNHHASFAIDGTIYYTGGEPAGGGDQSSAAFKFDIAGNRWDPVPQLQFMYGSHATLLNGRAYIGDGDGSLQEFDPRQPRMRRLMPTVVVPRDHSQVVAFLGEIWIMGGRSPETATVTIYDPASGHWRVGPHFAHPRGGFAAAVVDDQIVIAGGEIIATGLRVVQSVEVYTPGFDNWGFGPLLPVAVHGVPAVAHDGRFFIFSGSTQAAQAGPSTGRTLSIQLVP